MELNVSYSNWPGPSQAESYLEDQIKKSELIAAKVCHASAKVIKEQDGSNLVQLSVESPKSFRTVVSTRHESLYTAMHGALYKLKRNIVRAKDRLITARRSRYLEGLHPKVAFRNNAIQKSGCNTKTTQIEENEGH